LEQRSSGRDPDGTDGTTNGRTRVRPRPAIAPGKKRKGEKMTTDGHDQISSEQREFSRRRFLRNAGVAAAAVPALGGLAQILSQEGASAATYRRNSDNAVFASHPKYHFVVVNHVTTNSFFTATIDGIQDACALTGCSYQWTGSANSVVSQMVSAMNTAIAAKANGIGVALIDNTAFNTPVDTALGHGIPVIAYNADVEAGFTNNRMSYVGQNNLTAGAAVAKEVLQHVSKGDLVAGVIATPGTANLQPRITGAKPVFAKAGVEFQQVGTSPTEGSPETNKISSWYAGHKDVKFMFSVDGGDSDALATFVSANKLKGKVGASGWDVGTPVIDAVSGGNLDFTIDQQAYLQGFDTIMQLYLYNVSGGLMQPTDTDTGLGIVTSANVKPYLTPNRFEGSSSAQKVLTPPATIKY
jgi:simple sugar transport system substrate-binding protein